MKLETLLTSSLETPLPLHISLSAPLSIATEMKNAFAENLQQRLPAIALPEIKLSDLNWVSNNEGTRWFLVLRCEHPGLDRLLAWSNEVCRELGLEQLYTSSKSKKNRANEEGKRQKLARAEAADSKAEHNGRFHFSIAWTLSAPCTQNDPMVSEQVEEKLRQSKAITVPIDTVKVKVGNVVTSLDLQRGRHEGRGILG